ncbi:Uncharacterised protein [Mycobacteroides abscessus subsp. abscessus]|uniref:hypothetical protein n=1 Tax=Mycobacteroides abscessus TaxID=36809 RepID=UPI000929D244|nr:hypothetical protein [Mycobacteroides abscessus]SHR30079.1 Uncharacterised protein [Mycobacteroides abscessus subsp. abscessus]
MKESIERQVLSPDTELSERDDDELMSMGTLDFERLHNIEYGRNSTLIPSVNSYDLPLISDEQAGPLISDEMAESLTQTILAAAEQVDNFDLSIELEATEMARSITEAVRRLEAEDQAEVDNRA